MQTRWLAIFSFIGLIFSCSQTTKADDGGESDRVETVPSLIFKPDFGVYSGYLRGNADGALKIFYVMITSRTNRSTDPLLFYFTGGPGCSSVITSFLAYGPMLADVGGERLFENIYSFNREANVVFVDSPVGVGFSYDMRDPKYTTKNDDEAADQNVEAVADFFKRAHPRFKDRRFYVAGVSYGGVYVPMLAERIAERSDDFPNKWFSGLILMDGAMDTRADMNTALSLAYSRGLVGEDEWRVLTARDCCKRGEGEDVDACDWFYLARWNMSWLEFETNTPCGRILDKVLVATKSLDTSRRPWNAYSLYLDCYSRDGAAFRSNTQKNAEMAKRNPAATFNWLSTDPFQGYTCYDVEAGEKYTRRADFLDAFHIDRAFREMVGGRAVCNIDLLLTYTRQYDTVTSHIEKALDKFPNLRILVMNGDVDLICNFLGSARFARQLAQKRGFTSSDRHAWFHRGHMAGFVQRYFDPRGGNMSTIDVLTIRGGGHESVIERPGATAQAVTRFIHEASTYGEQADPDTGIPDFLPLVEDSSPSCFLNMQGLLRVTLFPLLLYVAL